MQDSTKSRNDSLGPPLINGEYLYTPVELAKLLSRDVSTIRRMFVDEEGVIRFGKANRRDGKRDYVTLRIPASVVQRVLGENTVTRGDQHAFALQATHRRMQTPKQGPKSS